jgi:hypothetical protein
MLPNAKLHDTELTRKKGLIASVMDYAPANIAPPGAKQGDYFTTTLGPYDYWAIEYAYRPLSGGTEEEKDDLAKIAARAAANPDLAYATDEDLRLAPDPQILQWDLGADPVQFAADRLKLAQACLPKIADAVIDSGEGYQRVRAAFQLMLAQYGNAALIASRQMTGFTIRRDHKGDTGAQDPITPISAEKRRAALTFLCNEILRDSNYRFPPELLRKLGADYWHHWGNDDAYRTSDFPLNERILGIQYVVFRELFDSDNLSRIQNAAAATPANDKPFTLAELFQRLSEAIFDDLGQEAASTPTRRNLQRAYVQQLTGTMLGRSAALPALWMPGDTRRSVPADARSLARLHLHRLQTQLKHELSKPPGKDEYRAHLEELNERIRRALALELTTTEP